MILRVYLNKCWKERVLCEQGQIDISFVLYNVWIVILRPERAGRPKRYCYYYYERLIKHRIDYIR